VLNIGWSYFILKVAYQGLFVSGSIANDARSDDSSAEDDVSNEKNVNAEDTVDKSTSKKQQ
jgi:hypothetical protein